MKNKRPINPFLLGKTTMEVGPVPEVSARFKEELLEKLKTMSLPALRQLIAELLRQCGFYPVELVEPTDKRGRTRVGGIDMLAYMQTDLSASSTLVQVKRHKGKIPRRCVLELPGAMKTHKAQHALLITTSEFSRAALAAAAEQKQWMTVIDGLQLVALLLAKGMGVKTERVERVVVSEETVVDESFFDKFEKKSSGTGD